MRLSKRWAASLILLLIIVSLSGCASLGRVPGALIGGTFNLIGGALSLAKKLPWWMWI